MTIRFAPLTREETLQQYPSYFREDITCFLILKESLSLGHEASRDWDPVGLYGLIDRGVDPKTGERLGEGFLTVFPKFRFQILNKTFLQSLFDHAFTSGFQTVYTWTRLPSWQKVLQRFEREGIHLLKTSPPWDSDQTKIWFVKEQPQHQPHNRDEQQHQPHAQAQPQLKKQDPKKGQKKGQKKGHEKGQEKGESHVFWW